MSLELKFAAFVEVKDIDPLLLILQPVPSIVKELSKDVVVVV